MKVLFRLFIKRNLELSKNNILKENHAVLIYNYTSLQNITSLHANLCVCVFHVNIL